MAHRWLGATGALLICAFAGNASAQPPAPAQAPRLYDISANASGPVGNYTFVDPPGFGGGFGDRALPLLPGLELRVPPPRDDFGFTTRQGGIAAALRLIGDDTQGPDWLPELSVGLEFADRGSAADPSAETALNYYISGGTQLFDRNLALSATLRLAGQGTPLPAGRAVGDDAAARTAALTGSASYLMGPGFAVGVDYRMASEELRFSVDEQQVDVFASYSFGDNLKARATYTNFREAVFGNEGRGIYFDIKLGF